MNTKNGTAGKMKLLLRFRTCKELATSDQVDAIIIATPDHLHVPIATEPPGIATRLLRKTAFVDC